MEKINGENIRSNAAKFVERDRSFKGRGNPTPTPVDAAQYLFRHPQWLRNALDNGAWARLLTALLGGQRDYDLGDSAKTYGSIATFLQMPDQRREELFASLPIEWMRYVRSVADDGDIVYNLAVFLDRDHNTAMRASLIPPRFSPTSCVFPTPLWPAVKPFLEAPVEVAAACSPLLEAATFPTRSVNLAGADATEARRIRFRIADSARRTIRRFSPERALNVLKKLPAEYQLIFFDCWALVASDLGEFKSLESFYNYVNIKSHEKHAISTIKSNTTIRELLSEKAKLALNRENLLSNINTFNDDRVYYGALWLDINETSARVPLADVCATHNLRRAGGGDLPRLPPPYPSTDPLVQALDDLSAIERFPGSLDFLVEEAAYRIAKSAHDARPEIAAVLRNLPWETADAQTRSQIFGEDASEQSRFVNSETADAPLLWRLRARIRSLARLSEEKRRGEELNIAASIGALPEGLLSAQCVELLAERSAFLDKDVLVSTALAVAGLSPLDRAYLSVRLFHLISRESAKYKISVEIIKNIKNISDIDDQIILIRTLYKDTTLKSHMGDFLDGIIDNIQDPIKRNYAKHRASAVLSILADGLLSDLDCLGGEAFAPLIVHAALNEALALSERVQAERTTGKQHLLDASAIATILVRESISCGPGVMVRSQAMLEPLRGTALADQLSAIVGASFEGVGPQNVRGVAGALLSDYDDVRARARALILPENWDHFLSASGGGLETVLLLADERAGSLQPGIGVQLGWRLERTRIDSPWLLRELVDLAAGTGERAEMALGVFNGICQLDIDITEQLAAIVPGTTPRLRSAIWLLFARATRDVTSNRNTISLPPQLFGPGLAAEPNPWFILGSPQELVHAIVESTRPENALAKLRREHGHTLSDLYEVLSNETERLIGRVGATYFARSASLNKEEESIVEAAHTLLSFDNGPARATQFLDHLLRNSITDPQPGPYIRSDVASILAAAANISPAKIIRGFESADARARLAAMATGNNSFPGRRAAFLLMGHIIDAPRKYLSPAQTAALLSVEIDVPQVIDAALVAAARLRATTPNSITKFKAALRGPSASKSALAGRMLISIARSNEIPAESRADILKFVGDFVHHPLANRAVYFGRLDALTPVAPTIRDQLLEELAAIGGGVIGRSG